MDLDVTVVALTTVVCEPGRIIFPNIVENLELSGADWLHGLEDRPSNAFSARWRGKGSIVAPELINVERLKETLEAKRSLNRLLGREARHLCKESVFTVATFLDIKHDAENGAKTTIGVQVHDVQFKIHILAHDGVL